MNRLFSITLLLLVGCNLFGQEISGVAYYTSKTTMNGNFGGRELSEQQKKMIMERMRQFLERSYTLEFTAKESIFKEEEKLDAPASGRGGGFRMSMAGGGGTRYKNLATKESIEETELFGKEFLILDTLSQNTWKLGKETKQIGQYQCYKATMSREVPNMEFRFGRRGDNEAENDSISKTRTIETVAWFTFQIPISNGPAEFGGLPGLILELQNDRTTILCTKVVMNPKEPVEIKIPKKGKKVSRSEFEQIQEEKIKEMRDQFQGRGGRREHRIMIN